MSFVPLASVISPSIKTYRNFTKHLENSSDRAPNIPNGINRSGHLRTHICPNCVGSPLLFYQLSEVTMGMGLTFGQGTPEFI
ncbi:hypothetical protein ACTXT7_004570 [Hymenolepis weldensis]